MNTGGWIMMLSALSGVTGLFAWCIYKVLATPGATEHLRSEANIEPPDVHDD
jgi:hypothetical protein